MSTRVLRVLKRIFFRVWGTGKVTLLAVVAALTMFTASTALAANGGNFILGVATNTATAITTLTANISNPALHLKNTSTGTNATALKLETATTKAPMTVNSKTKVTNLNADTVDGNDSTALLPGGNLPSGRTVRGTYEIDGHAASGGELVGGDSISFGYRLASTPTVEFVRFAQSSTTNCPGSYTSPEAAKGYLCIYENFNGNLASGHPVTNNRNRTGAGIFAESGAAGDAFAYGTWAVTAP